MISYTGRDEETENGKRRVSDKVTDLVGDNVALVIAADLLSHFGITRAKIQLRL